MTEEDEDVLADCVGEVIARLKREMRADLDTAIAAAKVALIAEARMEIAEVKAELLQKLIDALLTREARDGDRARVIDLPSRRTA